MGPCLIQRSFTCWTIGGTQTLHPRAVGSFIELGRQWRIGGTQQQRRLKRSFLGILFATPSR
ncbi:hypothetical protein Bca101_073059 [Brassica carinata]|uniref:Uncharacterized protein n=1 Tax=Brassica oleracea TaxID=3712 RepID=A0A3P6F975_BRAOL|nr:unnamed protein product [Brassica oleracea]